jgi:hypothetical protein
MKIALLILGAVLTALPASAAQFIEIEATFEVIRWQLHEETGLRLRNTRTYSVHCVAGTNLWLIEHQPRTNVTESTWFVNRKLIRLTTLTRDPAFGDSPYLYGRRGSRSASILPAPDGYPGGELLVNLPWFAFCSGPFLHSNPRGVPVPTSPPDRPAFGFTNETSFFQDDFGLPRRAAFYADPRQLKCLYEVQQSTNLLGWNFPTAFTVTHNASDRFGHWDRELTVNARVTLIRSAPDFAVPNEILTLEMRETQPARRKPGNPVFVE